MTVIKNTLVGPSLPPTYYICDTEAELPSSGLAEGDIAYAKDTDAFFKAISSTTFSSVAGAAGAPTGADYLVGTANGSLSGEIVVGTSPGGELGGTWASPTVDATHSGTSHAGAAASAVSTHEADTDGSGSAKHHTLGTGATQAAAGNHTHPGGSEAFPVGSVFVSVVSTNPATLLGYGTWSAFGAGRVLIGNDGATYGTDEATGGSATSAVSAHSGSAVGNHVVTQPGAHSAHVVTQPSAHSAHVVTQPTAHADVLNHVHVQSVNTATTGGLSGYTPDTSTNTSAASGYSTANPTANGVASQVHTGTAVDAHSAHAGAAVDAHSAHSGTAVDAHAVTQPSAHTDINVVQPYVVVHMWKRTA